MKGPPKKIVVELADIIEKPKDLAARMAARGVPADELADVLDFLEAVKLHFGEAGKC